MCVFGLRGGETDLSMSPDTLDCGWMAALLMYNTSRERKQRKQRAYILLVWPFKPVALMEIPPRGLSLVPTSFSTGTE